ncbi:L-proline dehydrogenase [Chitinophaga skermanii]|uniref:L-proline dehydrogenase n=1 Tax=Chitinophaga skermanii TaxID=331697 RepID=A0A327QLV2_9BACT|nr:proline dehydrogenase family protein [Chitinophaga skermanii]RAJ05310.1 L-proline dehydrogenase [Chitinophaga skermanii]
MPTQPKVLFSNTEDAFAYKHDKALQKANFLFSMMGKPWLVNLGTRLTPWALKWHLPVKSIIKQTIFEQFVGGETLSEVGKVVNTLDQYNVQVILDYGAEGKESDEDFERTTNEFLRILDYGASKRNIPFIGIKITGFARFALLEKLNDHVQFYPTTQIDTNILNTEEKQEWERVIARMHKICAHAHTKGVGVLVDAEESWIQNPIDALTLMMMAQFNTQTSIVYNTYQMYRHDRLAFFQQNFQYAQQHNFILAGKIVRGAYMEKERARAITFNYPSPIQPNKAASDKDFDAAIAFGLQHIEQIALIIASHNEQSALQAVEMVQNSPVELQHKHVHFSQLYGMSDHMTFNLAKAGCNASKYLPYGPLQDVVPYLMRRARENSAVAGETSRELGLIKKELQRRKAAASHSN